MNGVLTLPRKRIRVAQIVTRFIAGAGGVALRGAEGLDPEHYEVVILTAPGGPLVDQARARGFEVLLLRHMQSELAPRDDVAGVRELRALLEVGRFDLVHTHSAKAGAIGRIAAHQVGVPAVIHTFHGFPFHDFQSPLRRAAYINIERRLGRVTDRIIAVSSSVAAETVRLGIAPAERVRVIPVSIDDRSVERTAASRSAARKTIGIGDDVPVVGTVGRLDYQKAPGHFLEAMQQLRRTDAIGVWIGGGPLREETEQTARKMGMHGRIRFLGERDDVPALLPAFDVFLMTSLYEGLPCAAVEAMQCGLPVVATAVNGVPEIVMPGETGLLVPPARPPAAARAVDHLLDHPEQSLRMGENARRSVRGRFTASETASALASLYQETLSESRELAVLPAAS